jgi:Spy/CpxP family protein refolding chaperone
MKLDRLLVLLFATLLLSLRPASAAETTGGDPLGESLFLPDLILQNGEAIGLSDAKRQEIQALMEKAQGRFPELQQALQKEQATLIALVDRKAPDDAILKQLDSLIARERDFKREQITLMLSLRRFLSVEQQAKLKELRKTHNPAAIEARLKEKLARVEAGVQKIVSGGGQPVSIMAKMQSLPELMRLGKVEEAEGLLDQVLNQLDAK